MGSLLVGRLVVAVLVLLIVMAVLAAGLATWSISRAHPTPDGEVVDADFGAQVEVKRDAQGVPRIYANSAEDLFRAQGYVHAQDRFFEMDFRRHLTSGRLAEWFGPDLLETDMVVRTMGWYRTAEAELEKGLDPDTVSYLQAYAEGVNTYLDDHSGSDLSVEYTMGMLGPEEAAEPWTAVDSLAWLKAMAWDLRSNIDDEISRVLATEELAPERVDELYPDYPYDRHAPIVSDESLPDKLGNRSPGRAGAGLPADAAEVLERTGATLRAAPSVGERAGIGSNSWVVDGSRTATGKPLLANDPHLAPSMPSTWYQVGLHCREINEDCPFDVSGFSFAGLPGVVIGHNQKIAWGFTNLGADVGDLYLEQIDGNSYVYDGERRPLDVRREVFRVKGQRDVTIDVRETRHGPLLSDVDKQLEQVGERAPQSRATVASGLETGVSLRWTALRPGKSADALFAMNAATGWQQFRDAARNFEVPSQNLVYADVEGNIGYQAPGRIPVRGEGDGRWPALGWSSEYEWDGYIPYDQLPRMRNPKSGMIVTANNAVASESYRHQLPGSYAYGYRSERIRELLLDEPKLDVADISRIQNDDKNLFAETLVPYLVNVEVNEFTRPAQDLLRGWNGEQPADSAPAAYYNAVWRKLLQITFGDSLPEDVWPSGGDRWYEVVRPMLEDPDNGWWDKKSTPRTETRDDILRDALHEARLDLTRKLSKDPSAWEWGKIHRLELRSQTFGDSGIDLLERLFNRGPYNLGGGSDAVNATSWNAAASGFDAFYASSVPSMRMVVDLADFDNSRWINLAGQSGHPWHANYVDQTELWLRGGTLPWAFGLEAVDEATEHSLLLRP